jgi:hypothetical protein
MLSKSAQHSREQLQALARQRLIGKEVLDDDRPETRQLAGVCSPLPQILRTGFDHIAELLEHVDEGILFE